ncbi:unnamed protein product [Rotaria socialis]
MLNQIVQLCFFFVLEKVKIKILKKFINLQIKVSYFILRGFAKVQRDSFNDVFVTNVNLLVDCIIVVNLLL